MADDFFFLLDILACQYAFCYDIVY